MGATMTPTKPRAKTEAPPADMLTTIRREMDDLLGRFWNNREEGWFAGVFNPAADVTELGNAYQVRLDIPGMQANNIEVQVHGNQLTVSGQREEEREEKGKTFHRLERRTGKFSRSVMLPGNVNEDEVAAEYTQGVLTVTLPKCEEKSTKKVAVKG